MRIILIVLGVIVCAASVSAQSFQFGITGGANLSTLSNPYTFMEADTVFTINSKYAIRYRGGALARLNFNDYISIQTEIGYVGKGARYKESLNLLGSSLRLNGDVSLAYIEMPLLLRLSTKLPPRDELFYLIPGFTYHVYAGGFYAYSVRAKFNGTLSGIIVGGEFEEGFEDEIINRIDKNDYGIVAGIGFDYGLYSKFSFEIRYTHSLNDIARDALLKPELTNSVFSLVMGFTF